MCIRKSRIIFSIRDLNMVMYLLKSYFSIISIDTKKRENNFSESTQSILNTGLKTILCTSVSDSVH